MVVSQKLNLEYLKELRELHYDYPLAPGEIEIKRKMWSEYQSKVAGFYNVLFGKIKRLLSNASL